MIINHQRDHTVQPRALSGAPVEMCHLRDEWALCLHVSCPKQISRLDIANLWEYAKLQQGSRRREENRSSSKDPEVRLIMMKT